MKIIELRISNILSFKHYDDICNAPKIIFDKDLNILVGENGSGKSTAMEVINFVFKRVLFTQFVVSQELYGKRNSLNSTDKKRILSPANNNSYTGFRLEPNWNSENASQKIRLVVELDEIDEENIRHLIDNYSKIEDIASSYANHSAVPTQNIATQYTIDITLDVSTKNFSLDNTNTDPGYLYLVNYNFYKEIINFYNLENSDNQINPLYESFTLVGAYRNYNVFTPAVSLRDSYASQQIQQIRDNDFLKSLNTSEQSEPSIFNLVRLRAAEKHYDLGEQALTPEQKEEEANRLPFLVKINDKLKLVNLRCRICQSKDQRLIRNYSFEFVDLRREKILKDINSLSGGQKAIIHLVFEAYGRGDLKGGVVIIDEPEIHLHYQFQTEYLQIIEKLNQEQECQYILVTHSESLINSVTIHKVKRFALDAERNTIIRAPALNSEQRMLIKILDNTRSTYAFFAKKVILVEGESDRYFFKSLIKEMVPDAYQEIAVLDINGKPDYEAWRKFFDDFGLDVNFIGDLDQAFKFLYPDENAYKLSSPEITAGFKCMHPDIDSKIEQEYENKIYMFKNGDLEHYLDLPQKGLVEVIKFCNERLENFLVDEVDVKSKEIKNIIRHIIDG